MKIEHIIWQGIPLSNSPGKERMLELQLLDVRMPAVVLNDPKMERGIWIDNYIVDQLEQVAETCISTPGRKRGNVTLIVEFFMAS